MADENSADRIARAKFSDAGGAWWRKMQKPGEGRKGAEDDVPLADLVERVLREANLSADASRAVSPEPLDALTGQGPAQQGLSRKLIEELSDAQELLRAEPPKTFTAPSGEDYADTGVQAAPGRRASLGFGGLNPCRAASKSFLSGKPHPKATFRSLRSLRRGLRPTVWRRNYLIGLSLAHNKVFDRRIERLLFFKTRLPDRYAIEGRDGEKFFQYAGPIPSKLLDWALSALPADLKRFAFIDFHADNGRALLLASRRNFEHAGGYAHDAESCEILEMNLAQYSRSYMSCRDVRALRAGRDGLAIPRQPAVLFFPQSLSPALLEVVLTNVAESLLSNPRPVYLIFENSGRERESEHVKLFQRVPVPLLNRVKAFLFSPAPVSVYKSREDGSGNSRSEFDN